MSFFKSFVITTFIYLLVAIFIFLNSDKIFYEKLYYKENVKTFFVELKKSEDKIIANSKKVAEGKIVFPKKVFAEKEEQIEKVDTNFICTQNTNNISEIFQPLLVALEKNKNRFFPKNINGKKIEGKVVVSITFLESGVLEKIEILNESDDINLNYSAYSLAEAVLKENFNNIFVHNLDNVIKINIPIDYKLR